jgi:hypothetical protein
LAGDAVGEQSLRLRVEWGGGAQQRIWNAVVGVDRGTISEPSALGIEADEPGSMWLDAAPVELQLPAQGRKGPVTARLDGEHLRVRQRSPRTYDGVDLLLSAPADATLYVQLSPRDGQGSAPWMAVALAELVGGTFRAPLDDCGNRLLVRRCPGDELRVRSDSPCLVFSSKGVWRGEVEPHLLPVEAGSKLRLRAQLLAARSGTVLRECGELAFTAGEPAKLPLEVRLDRGENVYDLVISAVHAGGLRWPQHVAAPLALRPQVVAERRVQMVVLEPDRPATAPRDFAAVAEIDPANPRWWERVPKLPQLPRLGRKARGSNGQVQPVQHALGPVVQLRPSGNPRDPAWEAYPLPIRRPGAPHILEIDYPSDVPQTMGISIIEPNAAGAVMPIGLDSGIEREDPIGLEKTQPHWEHHRLPFWPKTQKTMVLITNRRDTTPAVFGRIRVLSGPDALPRAFPPGPQPERLWAAYFDRPLLAETFGASDPAGALPDMSTADWVTFYEAGTRLVEYLRYAGYNGLMLTALADGSTIYPSRLLAPTPRYDTGAFFPTGQDPVRKDVLEMLFQLFDREGLQLIPALEFAAPLPELELLLARGGRAAEGLQWIGADGSSWTDHCGSVRGLAPYYNVLHPRVQEAMLAVVRELLARYGQHRSLAGLGLQLSGHGYAQLPGPEWGLDDVSIAHFQQDTGLRVPGEGSDRFAQRAAFVAGEAAGRQWVQWRADKLAQFHRRVAAELTAVRPHARLYLAGAESLYGEKTLRDLQPSLSRRASLAETLLGVGLDARHYRDDPALVLLRPERIAPHWPLAARAVDLQIAHLADLDTCYSGQAVSGSLFFHAPLELRLPSFDERSPFRPTYTWLVTHAVPGGAQNRRRFVHRLATDDPLVVFDGGWELPLGEEDSLRPLVAAYRQLPAMRFDRLADAAEGPSSQPVAVCYGTHGNYTYVYAANDAPFESVLRLGVEAPEGCQVEELTGLHRIAPLERSGSATSWSVELAPYDLVAVRFASPDVRLHTLQSTWPEEVHAALQTRISELGERAAALRNPPLLAVLENPGFEEPAAGDQVPGWIATAPEGTAVRVDGGQAHGGKQSLHLESRGPAASLASQPFAAPATGRLWLWLWLRTADEARQPPLELVLEGKFKKQDFRRLAQVGRPAGTATAPPPIPEKWKAFVFPVNDLPLEGLSPLRVRFNLLGAGEVWVDDLQLCDLKFQREELNEILRLISPADVELQHGQVADCLRVLDSYWARFLVEHVPAAALPLSRGPTPPPRRAAGEPAAAPHTGFLERMKGLLPERLRY